MDRLQKHEGRGPALPGKVPSQLGVSECSGSSLYLPSCHSSDAQSNPVHWHNLAFDTLEQFPQKLAWDLRWGSRNSFVAYVSRNVLDPHVTSAATFASRPVSQFCRTLAAAYRNGGIDCDWRT